jgi:hypothetical protein
MQFLVDEVITIAAGATTILTRTAIDGATDGRARARLALVHNHNLGSVTLALRVGAAPDSVSYLYLPLPGGQAISYEGYDNIIGLQIKNLGSVSAKIYVQYFA